MEAMRPGKGKTEEATWHFRLTIDNTYLEHFAILSVAQDSKTLVRTKQVGLLSELKIFFLFWKANQMCQPKRADFPKNLLFTILLS